MERNPVSAAYVVKLLSQTLTEKNNNNDQLRRNRRNALAKGKPFAVSRESHEIHMKGKPYEYHQNGKLLRR